METERQAHGSNQEGVDPWLHHQQGLVLRQGVKSVAHLNGDQDGQGHGHGFVSLEQVAGDALELLGLAVALEEVGQLPVVDLGSGGIVQEPVSGSSDRGGTNVSSDGHVTEEQPGGDQSFGG